MFGAARLPGPYPNVLGIYVYLRPFAVKNNTYASGETIHLSDGDAPNAAAANLCRNRFRWACGQTYGCAAASGLCLLMKAWRSTLDDQTQSK